MDSHGRTSESADPREAAASGGGGGNVDQGRLISQPFHHQSDQPFAPSSAHSFSGGEFARRMDAGFGGDALGLIQPSLSRANSNPVESGSSPHSHQHNPSSSASPLSFDHSSPPPGLSLANAQANSQQMHHDAMMRHQHGAHPHDPFGSSPSPTSGGPSDLNGSQPLRVNTNSETLSGANFNIPVVQHQRPSVSHSDLADMTPRQNVEARFESNPLLDNPSTSSSSRSDSPAHQQGTPFAPMPGFPAVGDLGGYPTGDGGSKERPISSPSAPGLTIGMGRDTGEKRALWLGDLEGWMDEAYLRQMCSLMGWDIVAIKLVRQPPPSNASPVALAASPTSNNYAFITFPTAHLASRILHTLTPSPSNPPIMMPNSTRPFKVNWASSSTTSTNPGSFNPAMMTDQPIEKEYSIFVGDLAPEVTEGDLVRLFLNPPARLPADGGGPRKSFTSVRSAKIMLDPKGGGSRGYGFVRFAEEADQLRALSEMQGVYCLSRPMRLSHATAKNRSGLNPGGSQGGSSVSNGSSRGGTPTPAGGRSSPYGPSSAASDVSHLNALDAASRGGPSPVYSFTRGTPSPVSERPPAAQPGSIPPPERRLSPSTIEYLTQLAAANGGTLPFGPGMSLPSFPSEAPRHQQPQQPHPIYNAPPPPSAMHAPNDQSSYHLRQPSQPQQQSLSYDAVSPSSNPFPLAPVPNQYLSTPNVNTSSSAHSRPESMPLSPGSVGNPGLQGNAGGAGFEPSAGAPGGVNSTDPNNTTVFVGGLSSLISEETLKTFFAPFGEITYAKIPPGKGCGFVQFVRKQDAERAIERMQGFPIGGGRIRLSWGRSQYKAAQAAAQAAQLGIGLGALGGINGLNPSQLSQLGIALQNLGGLGSANAGRGQGGMNPAIGGGGGGGAYGRGPQGPGPQMNGMGYNGMGGGGGGAFGGAPPAGGLGGLNLAALSNLNPQALQGLIALASSGGLGGGMNGGGGMGDLNVNGGLSPALLAQLSAQKDLNGFDTEVAPPSRDRAPSFSNNGSPPFGSQSGGGSSFTPFSPALSPVTRSSEVARDGRLPGLDARRFTIAAPLDRYGDDFPRSDAFGSQPHSAGSDENFLSSTYSSSRLGTSPVTSERAVGGGFPGSSSSLRNNMSFSGPSGGSPFDPDYRPTIPPLHTSSSVSSTDSSSRFFANGAFSPPLTAPGLVNQDYLQQQQQFAAPRARAASASVHSGGGIQDLAADMEGMELNKGSLGRLGGIGTGPGSGRSFGYGSFGGNMLRSQLPPASRFQADRGSRFDEDE